jgi:hypothetical protein
MSEKFNYHEWKSGLDQPRQKFEEFQMFACDWIDEDMTHEEGVEACVSGVLGHRPRANPDEIRKEILEHWGYLGGENSES